MATPAGWLALVILYQSQPGPHKQGCDRACRRVRHDAEVPSLRRWVPIALAITAAACRAPRAPVAAASCSASGLRVAWRGLPLRVEVEHGRRIASLYLLQGDRLLVMHASAALGTAIYERRGERWHLVRGFQFACRGQGPSCWEGFARAEGWSANVAEGGADRRFEVAASLAAPGTPFTVVSLDPFSTPDAPRVSACAGTIGDILDTALQAGEPPAELTVDPRGWPRVPDR